jgi:hypothetical protein
MTRRRLSRGIAFQRHSGAMRSIEPGIHSSKHSRGAMDSGPAPFGASRNDGELAVTRCPQPFFL